MTKIRKWKIMYVKISIISKYPAINPWSWRTSMNIPKNIIKELNNIVLMLKSLKMWKIICEYDNDHKPFGKE